MKKYELYLFDFDGTLVDSLDSLIDVFVLSFKAIDVDIDESNVLRYTRIPIEETYEEVHAPMSRVDEFIKAIRYYLNSEEVLKKTKIYPETKKIINELHDKGVKFGIVTSNNEKHVIDVLKLFDIPPMWFTIIVDSDRVKETKPSPKPILYALEELGYLDKREKVVYVGDAINDVISANSANVDAVLIDRTNEYIDSKEYQRILNLSDLLI